MLSPIKIHSTVDEASPSKDRAKLFEYVYWTLYIILLAFMGVTSLSIIGYGERNICTIFQMTVYMYSTIISVVLICCDEEIEDEDHLSRYRLRCVCNGFARICLILAHVMYLVVFAQLIYTPIILMCCELVLACAMMKLRIVHAPFEYKENSLESADRHREKKNGVEENKADQMCLEL